MTAATDNTEALRRLAAHWQRQDEQRRGPTRPKLSAGQKEQLRLDAWTQAAVIAETQALAGCPEGNRAHQAFKSAAALGQLVGGGVLPRAEAETRLAEAAQTCGLPEREARDHIRRGLDAGLKEPRRSPEANGHGPAPLTSVDWPAASNGETDPGAPPRHPAQADLTEEEAAQDATAADLIRVNATIRWACPLWLQFGVVNMLASEPGVGKTRLCCDLARRVYNALPWPDGSLATFPAGSRTLWVAADNQHPELGTLPGAFGFTPESLYLNTTRGDPFGGTVLDDPADLKAFEQRIVRVRPALVFVDTTLHATDRSAHKPEDCKAFFGPLQQIAARQGIVLIGVTHLNAAGKPLGRRVEGAARVVIMLERPDPDGQPLRRKLYVRKTNGLYPAPLGVTMGEHGNEYDLNPPEPVDGSESAGPTTPRVKECCEWLANLLADRMSHKVTTIRTEAEAEGFGANVLYSAKKRLGIEEEMMEGKKWWVLTVNGTELPG